MPSQRSWRSFSRRAFFAPTVAGALALSIGRSRAAGVSPEEARQIALDAYIYGYSLITTHVTRIQQSNVSDVEPLASPIAVFKNIRAYPPASFRGVSAANSDTLYSVTWLDLSEPQVFSHPEIDDRFFTFELVDLWMIVKDSVGTNTSGGKAATYLFTRENWQGAVPEGMIHMTFPTRYMVILGRTYASNTPEDLAKVHALQDQYKVVPLSSYGRPFTYQAPPVVNPGFSMTEAPQKVILGFGAAGYFKLLSELMASDAPPAREDAPMLARMAQIGIVPGVPFDFGKLDPQVQAALTDVPETATKRMNAAWGNLGKDVNGWRVTLGGGRYGTNYIERGAWAALGWPSQLPNVSLYPTTWVDSTGKQLNGANKYTLTFPRGQMPPVNPKAFWSLTMYTIDNGLWFYANPLNRFNINQPRDTLNYNADRSLTLYVQHESPSKDKEANWLPAPDGPFALTMRLYWPNTTTPSIFDGTWEPPGVQIVNGRAG